MRASEPLSKADTWHDSFAFCRPFMTHLFRPKAQKHTLSGGHSVQRPKPSLDRRLEPSSILVKWFFYVDNQTLVRFGIGINEDSAGNSSVLRLFFGPQDMQVCELFTTMKDTPFWKWVQTANTISLHRFAAVKFAPDSSGKGAFCTWCSTTFTTYLWSFVHAAMWILCLESFRRIRINWIKHDPCSPLFSLEKGSQAFR